MGLDNQYKGRKIHARNIEISTYEYVLTHIITDCPYFSPRLELDEKYGHVIYFTSMLMFETPLSRIDHGCVDLVASFDGLVVVSRSARVYHGCNPFS